MADETGTKTGTKTGTMTPPYNQALINVFGKLYDIMMSTGEVHRARAYKNAQSTIITIREPILSIDDVKGKPHIGATILKKVQEYIETGTLRVLEREKENPIHVFTTIYGIGPKRAKTLVSKHGITTIEELRDQQDDLLNDKQKIGLVYYEDLLERIPRSEIDEFKTLLTEVFRDVSLERDISTSSFEIVGSYRRGATTSGDIDIIVTDTGNDNTVFNAFLDTLCERGIILEQLSRGKVKCLTIGRLTSAAGSTPRRLDFMYSPPHEYAFATLYFTGSAIYNTLMRQQALDLGYTMNEHGFHHMIDSKKGAKVEEYFATEQDIFAFLDIVYTRPQDRIDITNFKLVSASAPEAHPLTQTHAHHEEITNVKLTKPKRTSLKKKGRRVNVTLKSRSRKKKTVSAEEHINKFIETGIDYLHAQTVKTLSSMLKHGNDTYYNDSPVMTDAQYDILKEYVQEHHPRASILKKIGADVLDKVDKKKVTLPYFMGSMDKMKPDTGALEKWMVKYTGPYLLSAKLDGVSALYSSEGGELRLYTRGNGTVGQDITHLIPYLDLPELHAVDTPVTLRGELIMSKSTYDTHYAGTEVSNARNFVAGTVNKKTIVPERIARIDFVVYEVIEPRLSPSEQYAFADAIPNTKLAKYKVDDAISNKMLSLELVDWRDNYEYEIDGIIVTDDKKHRRVKGNPKHAIAFKMVLSDQVVEAKVVDVIWTASKDGYLKPRVRIEPVIIGGAKIEYATGFNGAFVNDNKIGVGAVIQLVRSGDVIPHIMDVVSPAHAPKMPSVPYVWNETHVDIMLENPEENTEVIQKNILRFVKTLEVTGLSSGNITRIMDAGYDSLAKILAMTVDDFMSVEGFKEKMSNKIYTSLQERVADASLTKLMVASNLFGRGMGEKRIEAVLEAYPDILTSPLSMKKKAVMVHDIEGFASKTAVAFVSHIDDFKQFLHETGLDYKLDTASNVVVGSETHGISGSSGTGVDIASHPLYKKSVVMTGFRDKSLEAEIKKVGGKIGSSVSKKTFAVVVKTLDEDTGKAEKARELGVPLITVNDFRATYLG